MIDKRRSDVIITITTKHTTPMKMVGNEKGDIYDNHKNNCKRYGKI